MVTTKISESPKYRGSYVLEIVRSTPWKANIFTGEVLETAQHVEQIDCHNLSTAHYLAQRAEMGLDFFRSEPEGKEDTSNLRTTVIHGKFYGSYIVLVFDDAGNLVNEIPCRDSRTAAFYRDNPTARSF